MPLYAYRCARCGPFDARAQMDDATRPQPCPRCADASARAYTPFGSRAPGDPLAGASRADRDRVDRARSGAPTVTSAPRGRRLRTGSPHHH